MYFFTKGTKIHTINGLVAIEKIKVGDKVLSYNEKTGDYEYKRVAHTFVTEKNKLIKLKIKGEKKVITTSTEHPFYVKKMYKARDSLSSEDDEGEWASRRW